MIDRIVLMRINRCKYFKIPYNNAIKIQKILEESAVDYSYTIKDLEYEDDGN